MYFISLLLLVIYYGIILSSVYLLVRRATKGPSSRVGKFILLGTTLIVAMLLTNIFYTNGIGGKHLASWREFDRAIAHISFFFCTPVFLLTLPCWLWVIGKGLWQVTRSRAQNKAYNRQATNKTNGRS